MRAKLFRAVSLGIVVLLTMGMIVPSLAYESEGYSDIQHDRLGEGVYESIMALTENGIFKGVGGGCFAPEENLTAGAFLTVLGRAFYPDKVVEVGASVWWEPYYEVAMQKGILDNYDLCYYRENMDRDDLSPQEIERVLARMGLHAVANFSGDSFTRMEAAVIFARLLGLIETPEMATRARGIRDVLERSSYQCTPDDLNMPIEAIAFQLASQVLDDLMTQDESRTFLIVGYRNVRIENLHWDEGEVCWFALPHAEYAVLGEFGIYGDMDGTEYGDYFESDSGFGRVKIVKNGTTYTMCGAAP